MNNENMIQSTCSLCGKVVRMWESDAVINGPIGGPQITANFVQHHPTYYDWKKFRNIECRGKLGKWSIVTPTAKEKKQRLALHAFRGTVYVGMMASSAFAGVAVVMATIAVLPYFGVAAAIGGACAAGSVPSSSNGPTSQTFPLK